MILVRQLSVVLDHTTILDDIDLGVRPGEIVGLIGPPESGKTVLLKAIAGLLPAQGETWWHGEALTDAPQRWRARIGFAFQNDALFDALSVFENVAFPLRRRGVPESEVDARVRGRLADVGLAQAAAKPPHAISGGMRKRVGIARASIIEPAIGLFDDPVAGLDPVTATQILELIARLTRSLNMATLVVSNDLDLLFPRCHRVVMLHAGRVVYDGLPAEARAALDPLVVQFVTGADAGPL